MLQALELLTEARGITSSRAALAAALPMAQDELSTRLAPLALARVGIEAYWQPLGARAPERADMPLLAPLAAGGAVLLLSKSADGTVLVRDAAGEQTIAYAALRPLLGGRQRRPRSCRPSSSLLPPFLLLLLLVLLLPLLWERCSGHRGACGSWPRLRS